MSKPLTVAIVGAGPSGIYAAEALTSQQAVPVRVDVLDRLPVPFGLVRYGVAPDHFSIRSVRDKLTEVFERPEITFKGNVAIDSAASLAQLREAYDAVILTYGASADRSLGVPGEELVGSIPATQFVAWYCGHPDVPVDAFNDLLASTESIVVVGVGNVAIDVTRILAKTPAELSDTDIPTHVLDALAASHITDITVLGRRGPAFAAFTTKELRELGELSDAEVLVDAGDFDLDARSIAELAENKVAARNVEVMRTWLDRAPSAKSRRIHLKFWSRPTVIEGADRMTGVQIERTFYDDEGKLRGTGEAVPLPAQAIVRSVGYRGVGIAGVPFDEGAGTIPHVDGRVVHGGDAMLGLYVAGWIKRGPTGIIGTNKKDAAATVASLLDDVQAGRLSVGKPGDFVSPGMVSYRGWLAIDAAERALGASLGRERTTIHDRANLLALATEERSQAST